MRHLWLFIAALTGSQSLFGQGGPSASSSSEHRRTPKEWFHEQRAYPLGFIPGDARTNALRELDAMLDREDGGQQPRWKSIGPMPTQFPIGGHLDDYVDFPIRASGKVDALAVDPRNANVVYLGAADGGVWKTVDGGVHWTPLFDQQDSLTIGSLALDPQDPDTIYAGTGAELGALGSVALLYGDGIYKSTNGGATWQHFGRSIFGTPLSPFSDDGGARVVSLAVHPRQQRVILAAVKFSDGVPLPGSGIWRSADGGEHWKLVLASGDFGGQVLFDPTGNTAYAVLNASCCASVAPGVFKSTDGGETWIRLSFLFFDSYTVLAIAPSNPQILYALTAFDLVFKSIDGGLSWAWTGRAQFCEFQCGYDQVIAVDPLDPNIVVTGGRRYIHRSLDGGATWNKVDGQMVHPDHHALAFSADGRTLYDGNDGGVWRTTDITNPLAVSWAELNETLSLSQFYPGISIDPTNVNITFGGSQDNGIQKYRGNASWDGLLLGSTICGDGFRTAIDFDHPQTVYVVCLTDFAGLYIWRSEIGGDPVTPGNGSFHLLDDINFNPPYCFVDMLCWVLDEGLNFASPFSVDPTNSSRLYAAGRMIWQSWNRGNTWSIISPPLTTRPGHFLDGSALTAMAVAPGDANTIYVGLTGDLGLQRTTNALATGGATWTDITSTALPPRIITAIAVDPAVPATAYVSFSGFTFGTDTKGHIFKTTNGGTTWMDISANLPNIPVNAIVVDPDVPNTLYIGTDVGVFRTTTSGRSWETLVQGLPRVTVTDIQLHRATRTLRAATFGRGMWDLALRQLHPND